MRSILKVSPLGLRFFGFRGYENQNEQLKAVPDWQERLRLDVDELIKEFDGK